MRKFFIVTALALFLVTASAAAQTTPAQAPLAELLTGDAKADYDAGKALYGNGDNDGALIKFQSAYDRSKEPRLLWNMAACEKNLHHYARALRLVRQYRTEATLTTEETANVDALVAVMQPFTSKLTVIVSEPGAQVTVDGESLGISPVPPTSVDVGAHRIRVLKDGFEEYTRNITAGSTAEVTLDVALAKAIHEGRLAVRASQNASIAIDGRIVGVGTWSGALASGGHSLRVANPRMRPYQSEVHLQDHEVRDLAISLEPEAKSVPAWVWVVGGAVLAGGLATGGYFAFRKNDPTYQGPTGTLDPGVVQASSPIHFR